MGEADLHTRIKYHTPTHSHMAPPHTLTGEAAAKPAGASRGGGVLAKTKTTPNSRPVLQPSSLLLGAEHLL